MASHIASHTLDTNLYDSYPFEPRAKGARHFSVVALSMNEVIQHKSRGTQGALSQEIALGFWLLPISLIERPFEVCG